MFSLRGKNQYNSALYGKMSAARDTIMEISTSVSFDYPDAVRWQHLLVVHIRLGTYCFVNITTRAVLPQNSVETLIGFQAEYDIFL